MKHVATASDNGNTTAPHIWRMFIVVLLSGMGLGVVAAFVPKALTFAAIMMGLCVPIAIYSLSSRTDWYGHVQALSATLLCGRLAGLTHSTICGHVIRLLEADKTQHISEICSENAVRSTFFAGFCAPLLPAAMICLYVWYGVRHNRQPDG